MIKRGVAQFPAQGAQRQASHGAGCQESRRHGARDDAADINPVPPEARDQCGNTERKQQVRLGHHHEHDGDVACASQDRIGLQGNHAQQHRAPERAGGEHHAERRRAGKQERLGSA